MWSNWPRQHYWHPSNVSIAHASYSNVELGSYYAPNRITPGMTTNLSASVCAQRNSNVTIPVSFYFSPSANITGASTYLGSAYVDWNNDKDFDDPGEFVVNAPNVAADTLYSMGLSVPATATLGTTRMRLITALYYTGTVDSTSDVPACGSYPFGETLDYALDIVASNGVLTATNKALNLEFNSKGATVDGAIPLINNPKRQQIKIKRNFIDKALPDLPPVVFSYPKGYSKPQFSGSRF